MSTKIYHGVRFLSPSLDEVYAALSGLRSGISAIQYDETVQWAAMVATDAVDRLVLNPEKRAGADRAPLHKAISELMDRQREIKKTGHRDVEVDFDFTLSVLPFEGRVYGIPFTESKRLREFFTASGITEDFSYWNNSEGPEQIPDEEWERRGDTWNRLLDQDPSGRPSACGMAFEVSSDLHFPKAEDVAAAIPPLEDRAMRQARSRVRDRRFRLLAGDMDLKANPSGHWALAMKSMDYAASEQGKAEVEKEASEIVQLLPALIDSAMLIGTRPIPEAGDNPADGQAATLQS